MTDYTPTVWVDDVTKVNAANMNHLEQGVQAAQATANNAVVAPADPDQGVIPYFDGAEWTSSDAPATNEVPVFNGTAVNYAKLTDGSIASGAGVAVAKLSAGSSGQVLRMVGSTPTWSSSMAVSTTVAGLGTPPDGSLGMLIVGGGPYDVVALVYSTTVGKWVSPPTGPVLLGEVTGVGGTTYNAATAVGTLTALGYFKRRYDAGLRPSFASVFVLGHDTDGGHCQARVALAEFDDGDALPSATPTVLGSANDTGDKTIAALATRQSYGKDWEQPTLTAPTKAHAWLVCEVSRPSGTGNARGYAMTRMRWVG